jgi:predicted oxidoreductase
MEKIRIAKTDLEVSRIAYGCMGLAGGWTGAPLSDETRKAATRSVQAALDEGLDFFDHADIYGRGRCEEAFADIWTVHPGLRQKIVLQTKCGIRFSDDPEPGVPGRYDFSHDHIISSVEGSLKRLKTDSIDILLLHRPDALVEPDEVARAFDSLHSSGKVRHFGVSNHSAAQIELLRKSVTRPFVVNQLELNVVHSGLIEAGVSVNQDFPRAPIHGEGTLEYCRLHDITVQAWSPLAQGAVTGRLPKNPEPRLTKTAELVGRLAREKGVAAEAILISWLLRHPAGIQPVIGTTNTERISGCCQATSVDLSREEWYALLGSGRGAPMA